MPSLLPFTIIAFEPELVTTFAAESFVIIPPLPPREAPEANFSIFDVTFSTTGINFASSNSFGFLSYSPSMSETITRRLASSLLATRAESLSLSEKHTFAISLVETVSFWLIIGIIPHSRSRFRVFRRLRYLFLFEKSSSTKSTWETTMPYFSKPSCQILIKKGWPIEAAACLSTVVFEAVFTGQSFFIPKATEPEETIITSFPSL